MSVSDDISEPETTVLGDIVIACALMIIVVLTSLSFWAIKFMVAS